MTTVKKGLISSAILVGQSLSGKLIGVVSTLILARVLLPEDFGLVAIAVLMLNFLEVISNTGGLQYLLRSDSLTPQIVNTSWTIDFSLKVPLAAIFSLSSPFLASLYNDERLIQIIYVLSVVMVVQALKNPGEAFLRREQNYVPIVKLSLLAKFVSVLSAISIALVFESYWALIVGQLMNCSIHTAGTYYIHPHRPKFTLYNAKSQWLFSVWMIPQAVVGFFRTQLDTIMVSATFGKELLGSYHIMKYLAYIPSAHIVLPATQPLLVELAQVKHSRDYLQKQFNISFIFMMIISLPMILLIYLYNDLLILLLLGENWQNYSSLFATFSLLILSSAIYQQSMRVLLVYGHTKTIFIYEFLSFSVIYSTLFYLDITEILAFAKIRVGLDIAFGTIFFMYVIIKYLQFVNLFRLAYLVLPVIFCCTISAIFSLVALEFFTNVFLKLLIAGLSFYVSFFGLLAAISFSAYKGTSEWSYINTLIRRLVTSLVKSLSEKK